MRAAQLYEERARKQRFAEIALRNERKTDAGNEQRVGAPLNRRSIGRIRSRDEIHALPAPGDLRDARLEFEIGRVDVRELLFQIRGLERELLERRIADRDDVVTLEALLFGGRLEQHVET